MRKRKNHVWVIEWEINGHYVPRHSNPEWKKWHAIEFLRALRQAFPKIPYRLEKYEAVK